MFPTSSPWERMEWEWEGQGATKQPMRPQLSRTNRCRANLWNQRTDTKIFLTWTVFTDTWSDEEKKDGGWPRDNITLETCHPWCQHVKWRVASSKPSPTAGCWHPGSDNGWSDDWLRSNTLFHIFIVFRGAALTHFHSSVVLAWRSSPGKQNKNIYPSVYSLPEFSIELPAQAALWNTGPKKKCLQLLVHSKKKQNTELRKSILKAKEHFNFVASSPALSPLLIWTPRTNTASGAALFSGHLDWTYLCGMRHFFFFFPPKQAQMIFKSYSTKTATYVRNPSLPDRTERKQSKVQVSSFPASSQLVVHSRASFALKLLSKGCFFLRFSDFQYLSVSRKENTNIFRSRHNFKCMLLLNSQMPGPPSPRPTRVPGRLNTFSETVVTFDPCQATMRLGHVVEQAHSYLSVSRALAQGQLSSQPRGRRVHSHGAVPGLADQKKKKKSPLHSALFFIPTMGPTDDSMRSLIYVKQTRRNCCAWSPRWVGEREFSKLVQHLGTQQILFTNKGDFLYAICWLPV